MRQTVSAPIPMPSAQAIREYAEAGTRMKYLSLIPKMFHKASMRDVGFPLPPAVDARGNPTNLLLMGPNGSGKTHAAVAIALEYEMLDYEAKVTKWAEDAARENPDSSVRRFNVADTPHGVWGAEMYFRFMKARDIPAYIAERERGVSESERMDNLVRPRLMVIDDLDEVCGKDYGTPKLAIIRAVIDSRLEELKQTIVTGNRTIAAWGEVDTAIQSRLASYKLIKLMGKDRRIAT